MDPESRPHSDSFNLIMPIFVLETPMNFPMSQESRSTTAKNPNIVVFGQTGSGKSSLINMLAGVDYATVSSQPSGGTVTAQSYDIPKGKKTYTFWDTCGLNKGGKGSVLAQEAVNKLVNLLGAGPTNVSLIIYLARGHGFLTEFDANKPVFSQIRNVCGEKVPIALVVTGLELEDVMEDWWTRNKNGVEGLKLSFKGHACVTTTKGRNNIYEMEYLESRSKLWKLVQEHCHPLPNIILFGESGAGKSSIVNLIAGKPVAGVSDGLKGCTFKHERYTASIDDIHFYMYDTAGLNEGEQGRVPHSQAIHKLYTLIRSLDGVSLLIYCMQGRIKENAQANWILFHKVLCAEKVPIIAVETGLDHVEDLDGRRPELEEVLKEYSMVPNGVACIISFRGRKNVHEELYNWSQTQVRQLIAMSYRKEPWTTDNWVGQIYITTYSTKLCGFSEVRVEFSEETGNVVDKFIEETGMKEEESAKLRSTLLDAEKELRKTREEILKNKRKKKRFLNIL